MNTYKTPKGTLLPLIQLKGKDYMQVAHRLVWLNEVVESFSIETSFSELTEATATARSKVTIWNSEGRAIKSAMATKTESKKDFNDFAEKAETASVGRALAMLGFGTQHAIADLDEGERIVDAPVLKPEVAPSNVVQMSEVKKTSTFEKPAAAPVQATSSSDTEGWD